MPIYQTNIDDLTPHQFQGFFVGWPSHPEPSTLLRILENSYAVALAVDEDTGRVIGLANALSDGVLSAYIPLLEVLPPWQGQGIGAHLIELLREQLDHLYMIDLVCDAELEAFYRPLGFQPWTAMILRNYDNQRGAPQSRKTSG